MFAPFLFFAGIYLGGHPSSLPGFLRDPLVGDDRGRVYEEATDRIAAEFVRKVDKDKLLDDSLRGAVISLDDEFSQYFDPATYKKFNELTSGEFEGVGMTVELHKRGLKIVEVFDGGPAKKAGLKPGDLIVAVDGKPLEGTPSDAATTEIKGPAGTKVRLTIVTDGVTRVENIERAAVNVPVVKSRMVEHGGKDYAYASLHSFTSGAHGELGGAVRKLLKKGADGVVLDLRGNGGGLLDEAVFVSSLFIAEGTIVTTKGRSQPSETRKATGRSIDEDIPVVVLVDKDSASASEIVTGALQDRERATIVGQRTYGKGVFQSVIELSNGGALDITVGEYFTPDGRNLGPRAGKRGIEPDVKALDDPDTKKVDEALQAALKALSARA